MASIRRSPAMICAAYFMAKFGEPGTRGSMPPAEMGVTNWDEAYLLLFPGLGDGRSFETFRGSINQDRRHYIECLAGHKSDSEDRSRTLGDCPILNRNQLWARVLRDIGPADTDTADTVQSLEFSLPDEVLPSVEFVEGAVRQITVNAYERDPKVRRRCIAAHGTDCCVCGFSFGDRYGSVADGYIHVHHLRPLAEVGGEHVVDPVLDLRPVCPNCHAVLHRRVPAFSIEDVQAFLQ